MSDRLIAAYSAWRNEAFPAGSTRDDVDELHAELATIDEWVAGMVIPFVEHGTRYPLRVDIQAGIDSARKQASELRRSANDDDRALLDRYEGYLQLLADVFHAFLQAEP